MVKTVFKGRGALISGTCPHCPERVSVFLKENEAYKNSKCSFCGAEIYGDGISGIIREGHHVSLISNGKVKEYSVRPGNPCPPEIVEYDRKRQEEIVERRNQHMILEIPHKILKLARRDIGG